MVLSALVAGVGIGIPAARSADPVIQGSANLGVNTAKSGGPIKLLPLRAELAKHQAQHQAGQATPEGIVPPPLPCPQNGLLPSVAVSGLSLIPNCGLPELPVAAGEPYPGTMSYYGGHVQTHPREYLVLWGWDVPGAFGGRACKSENFAEGTISGTQTVKLNCDPDGAGKYMADFLSGIGGTEWANVQDQYYQTTTTGKTFIDESGQLLAGVWVDDGPYPAGVNPNLSPTNASNPAGYGNTYSQMALEASRAAQHFGINANPAALADANFIIAQPQAFSDPQAATTSSLIGYCAFHDYTLSDATGNAYYKFNGIQSALSYTNMPYTHNAGAGCGEGSVNSPGTLDAYSINLGHEVEETATDPGAEDVVNNITTGGTQYFGGWYDTLDGNENGDKCAYVGLSPLAGAGGPNVLPIPGALGNIKTVTGTFPVQSLWSDAALAGTGWCAGVPSTDLPGSLAGTPPYS
jgi:serine protease